MLVEAGHALGLDPVLLAGADDEPAASVARKILLGSTSDPVALSDFFTAVSHVVFENEFIPCDLLERAASGLEVCFTPPLTSMRRLQDKLEQKRLLHELGIPATRHLEPSPDRGADPDAWLTEVRSKFGESFVLKWAQLGYDGKGTFFANALNHAASRDFCQSARDRGVSVFAEEKIPFKRELSLVSAHSVNGQFAAYPLVISEQERGVCVRVTGPATALGVPVHLEQEARSHAERLARDLPLHGVFAIEFFETDDERLLVNEIAPRVHNTGHFTLTAAETSQFENHLRAVLGMPLGSTRTRPLFAMLNLLGPAGIQLKGAEAPRTALPPDVSLYWYGKSEIKPGRKLGHLTGHAAAVADLKNLVGRLDSCKNAWLQELKVKA